MPVVKEKAKACAKAVQNCATPLCKKLKPIVAILPCCEDKSTGIPKITDKQLYEVCSRMDAAKGGDNNGLLSASELEGIGQVLGVRLAEEELALMVQLLEADEKEIPFEHFGKWVNSDELEGQDDAFMNNVALKLRPLIIKTCSGKKKVSLPPSAPPVCTSSSARFIA
jgi:hypothetical protein